MIEHTYRRRNQFYFLLRSFCLHYGENDHGEEKKAVTDGVRDKSDRSNKGKGTISFFCLEIH